MHGARYFLSPVLPQKNSALNQDEFQIHIENVSGTGKSV
jgi:hypothetical protein